MVTVGQGKTKLVPVGSRQIYVRRLQELRVKRSGFLGLALDPG